MKIKSFLYIIIAITIPLGFWAAAALPFQTDIRAYNLASDEAIAAYETFTSRFSTQQGTQSIIVLEKASGWKTINDFQALDDITATWETQPEIEQLSSLANLRYPQKGILLPSSVPFLDLRQAERFQRRMDDLDKYADIFDKFLSKDQKYTLVFVTVPEGMTKELAQQLSQSAAVHQEIEVHYIQYDLIQDELKTLLIEDTILLAAISLGLILLGFYVFAKSLRGLGLIGLMVAFNIALTFVVMYGLSMQFTLHMITIPCMITVLSFTDIMHILYHQKTEYASAETDLELRQKILAAVRVPLYLTSLTNIVGFVVFLLFAENVHLFNFSLAAIIGVFIAYLSSRLLVIRLMDKDFIFIQRNNFGQLYRIHDRLSEWFGRRRNYILPLFLSLFVLLAFGVGTHLTIDSSEQEYALSTSNLTKGQAVLQTDFFGEKQAEIFIKLQEGTLWNKAILDQLEQIEAELLADFQPLFINSPTLVVRRYNRYLSNGNNAAFYIPQVLDTSYVEQLNRHKSQLGGDGIIDSSATTARIVFGFGQLKLPEARQRYEQLCKLLETKNTPTIRFELSGLQYLSDEATHTFSLKILAGLLISILLGSVWVFFLLKSLRKSIGVLLVNLFPILFALGVMLHFQLAVTPLTLFFLSILLGICVDDSIYLITQNRTDSGTQHIVPIFITSLVLSLGFLSLACAHFEWIRPFGWIFLTGISLAYVLDFFVLPLFFESKNYPK